MTHHMNTQTGIANSDINDSTGRFSILMQVREGMGIYDLRDHHIGHVDFVHFGAASETQQELGTGPTTVMPADSPEMRRDTIIDNIAEAFRPNDVPDQLQNKLLMSGYVRMDADGLFAADRFILPDQIARVTDGKVFLSVDRDQLIKHH